MKIKEKQFKKDLEAYSDQFLGYGEEQSVFTEYAYLTFLEYSVTNNLPYDKRLNKGYFVRILLSVLRDKYPGKFIGTKPVEGAGNSSFVRNMEFTSTIIENINWLDRTLSENCVESTDILGHYSTLKDFRVKRQSSYFSPEITIQETMTREGIQNILKRVQKIDYLKENFNHPRNVIQLLVGVVSQGERIETKLDLLLDEMRKQKK